MFPVQKEDIQRIRLSNGLTVLCVQYNKLPLVHMIVMVKQGSERDPQGKEGLADLTAEMLTLGTAERDSQQLAVEMEGLGARYSASSGWDASFVEVSGLSADFKTLMELLADILLQPAFPPDEMKQSQQRRISRIIQQRDQAEVIADEMIISRLLAGTPYAHPGYGTIASLGGLHEADPTSFYRDHYSSEDTVMLVIGDIKPDTVLKETERLFGKWKTTEKDDNQPSSPKKSAGRKVIGVNRPDLTQSQIRLGLLGITRQDEAFIPFKVMNYIFGGGGFSSRLMQRVRAEKGYTYGISSSYRAGRIAGPFVISTFTPTAHTLPAINEILAVMEEYSATGAGEQELAEARSFFRGSYPLKLETPAQLAREIIELELYDIPFDYLASYREAIDTITLKEIKELATTYLISNDLTIVVVGRGEDFFASLDDVGEVEHMEYSEVTQSDLPLTPSDMK